MRLVVHLTQTDDARWMARIENGPTIFDDDPGDAQEKCVYAYRLWLVARSMEGIHVPADLLEDPPRVVWGTAGLTSAMTE